MVFAPDRALIVSRRMAGVPMPYRFVYPPPPPPESNSCALRFLGGSVSRSE